ncbi:MAG: sulfite exporter TauE/SafE family protein [Syntrophales bacterium]|nr:sulfite exporter TauE/SafE family protein [Syntrophales bacterium]
MAPHATTLQYLGLIALGFGVGTYGTLVGAGGGFLLMPLLLLIYPYEDAHVLTAISLAVVFINTLSGAGAYARLKRIDYKSGLIFAAATIPGAIAGVLTTASVPRRVFEAIFGVFLIGMALFMFLRPKSETPPPRETEAPSRYSLTRVVHTLGGISFEYTYYPLLGITVFFFLGFLASFLGIGGGSLIVPILAYLLNFPVFIATATSQFIVAILTFTSSLTHIWIGSFHHGAHRAAALGMGVLIGAQMGAYLSNKLKGSWIIRSLALALTLVGVRILMATFWP